MQTLRLLRLVGGLAVLLANVKMIIADEGMWLLNAPPVQILKERHGFAPDAEWLEHVQKSAVRFNSGGSGAFVSRDGLIITNHHVGQDDLQKLSTETRNYVRDGFHAKSLAEEIRCVDLELNVLMSIEDVTGRVNAAVKPGADAAEAFAARRAIKAEIEKESLDKTGLRSDVITLYQGARYHLYRYKRFTDVRLVFAPEQRVAFFGGDPDNFEFPRYDLDFCLFRAYEQGKPAQVEHYLKWSRTGISANELVFVVGHPGGTSRLFTLAEMLDARDRKTPRILDWLKAQEVLLLSYSSMSEEHARRAHDLLFGYQNARKRYDGELAGLLAPGVVERKRNEETLLKKTAALCPELADVLPAWDEIASAQRVISTSSMRYNLLERYVDRSSTLLSIARALYRSAAERKLPSGQRLREHRDSNRASFELTLFSDEPVYDDLEEIRLEAFLTQLAVQIGVDDPVVQAALAGKSPRARAAELVSGTKIKDVAERRHLHAMDQETMAEAVRLDPMLGLAAAIDSAGRTIRKKIEEQNEVKEQAQAKISRVRYALDGQRLYPDATFTLRLSFGTVKGYVENGANVDPFTLIAGMYERSEKQGGRAPYELPAHWHVRRKRIELATPLNFASTCDIIGGNSGSPTLNRAGEFVGVVFDGNLQSLAADFLYSDEQARALSVDARAIIETLRGIYDAGAIADELLGVSRPE